MLRPLLTLLSTLLFGMALAQGGAGWTVESYQDAYSYSGLGSIWLEPYQTPAGLAAEEALLVVGCDPSSPNGFELLLQVGYATIPPLGGDGEGDLSMLVRFDQGAVLNQSWFLAEGFFGQELVAYYDLNEQLFAGLRGATNLAVRVQADGSRNVPEMTFQYQVGGFGAALDALVCGEDVESDWQDWDAEDQVVGSWVLDGDFGMVSEDLHGEGYVVAIYCSESADANGIEVDLGRYDLPQGERFDIGFRSGTVDFLSATGTVNGYGAVQLDSDLSEDRLLRYLRGVVDLTVTLRAADGQQLSFTVGNQEFVQAINRLGCTPAGF